MPRILYVEDNEDNVYMLRRRLTKLGYDFIVAGDGKKASKRRSAKGPISS